MKRITNASDASADTWVEDGLTYHEMIRQAYTNCVFSAGIVEGHPVDTMFIKLQRDGMTDVLLLVRPDEMAAIAWCATGALYSVEIGRHEEKN